MTRDEELLQAAGGDALRSLRTLRASAGEEIAALVKQRNAIGEAYESMRALAGQLAEALDVADSEDPHSEHAPVRAALLQAAKKAGVLP